MDIKDVAEDSILAIALNGNTISEVLNQFEVNFPSVFNFVTTKTESGHSIISISEFLSRTRHIHDLKRMNDFLTTSFEVAGLDIPKRNFKLSLANWITKILLSAYEMLKASKVEAVEAPTPQPESQPSQPDALEVLTETAPNNQVSELEAELLNVQELLKNTRKLADTLESKAYRLTIQITAANLAQLANKAEIKQIVLTRDEGTITESGTTVTTTGWLEAEQTLKQWAKTVISPTRADKCRIVFEFADGESFKLSSFELMQKHRFGVNLAKELLAELQYMAGEIIPAHMTQQDYENFCKFCKINPDVYKRLLNNWAIPA